MSDHALKLAIAYSDALEVPEPNEAETERGLNETLHGILETTSNDYGHAVRSVHAKSHGLLEGELVVHGNLPPELAQGLFASPGTYRAIVRISTNPGDILDDSVSVPRGMAIKLFGVDGARLPGSESHTTQDFVLVDGPAFAAAGGADFLKTLKMLAGTTDRLDTTKTVLSRVMRAADTALSAVGIESATIRTLGGAPPLHPLGATYYSQVPFRFGDHVAKFSVAPASPNLKALEKQTVNVDDRPNALREVVAETMIEGEAVWDFRVQLARDTDAQPIEDASVVWDEEEAPFATVATLRLPPQSSWSAERSAAIDDGMAFSVWHGLAAHRPMGSVNRLRRTAYDMSADYRGRFNGCPIHEPRQAEPLPA